MTKAGFIDELNALMAGLPASEQERLRAYFTEMIDDRIEMGMDEAAAVQALGAPEELLKDILPDAPLVETGSSQSSDGDIEEIRLHVKNADVTLRRDALPQGMTAQLRVSEATRFCWTLTDGVLTVSESDEVRRGLFRRSAQMTLALGGIAPAKLIADSYGGDIEIVGVEIADMAVLASSSGDIRLSRFTAGGRLEVTSRSGDIRLDHCAVTGDCKLEDMSGDVEIRALEAASLRTRTASGDVSVDGLRGNTAALGTVSGDIELKDAQPRNTLLCETTSGDVELRRSIAPDTRLSTASGDIEAGLPVVPGGVTVRAESRSGEVDAPFGAGPNAPYQVQARSVSGDITIRQA